MKKYVIMCLLIVLAVTIAGCSQVQKTTPQTPQTPQAKQGYKGGAGGAGKATETGGPSNAQIDVIKKEIMSMPKGKLTKTEEQNILYIREEEKLARDVYLTLYHKWGLKTFANIAKSEQTHMDLMKILIEKYNLTDPVDDHPIGVFTNPELQQLYKKLVDMGNKSVVDALKVGAMIEELDIKDLQNAINSTNKPDIKLVYNNLMKGSRNHLRAFISQLEKYGVKYVPKYISQEEFNKIISSPMEKGAY